MIEFQPLLKPQSSVKVGLNGGKQTLDDATIPFTIGFDGAVAQRQPTHVLVIDIPHGRYKDFRFSDIENDEDLHLDNYRWAKIGERKLYEVNKIDFIQFHSPGKHNLIFIFFKDPDKDLKKSILQKASLRNEYENGIYLPNIQGCVVRGQVAYCEELVEIPKQFFSIIPRTGFKKALWTWANRWFLTDPVDQCEFRKRAIMAFTLQPICWFMGFILRLVVSILFGTLFLMFAAIAFLFGGQSKKLPKQALRLNWDFLFLYRKLDWEGVFSKDVFGAVVDDYYDYKVVAIGKERIGIPISVAGLAIQVVLWRLFFSSFPFLWNHHEFWNAMLGYIIAAAAGFIACLHLAFVVSTIKYQGVISWVDKHYSDYSKDAIHPKIVRQAFIPASVVFVFFFFSQIFHHAGAIANAGAATGNFLVSKLFFIGAVILLIMVIARGKKFLKFVFRQIGGMFRWFGETRAWQWAMKNLDDALSWMISLIPEKKEPAPKKIAVPKPATRADWLRKNMDINQMPRVVHISQATAPTKVGKAVLRFRVGFWATKAKVCKPYAKA